MELNDKPYMKDVKFIILRENKNCRGCSTELKQGQEVINYNDEDIGGIYCRIGCLESYIDYYIESGRFGKDTLEFCANGNDPIVKKIKKDLGL